MQGGLNAYNHNKQPIQEMEGHESLSEYQNRKKEITKDKRSDREIMNELNKMFL